MSQVSDRHRPPNEMFLGTEEGTWPVQAFTTESHVVHWLQAKGPDHRRHAWKVHIDEMVELELTPPIPSKLIVKVDDEPGVPEG